MMLAWREYFLSRMPSSQFIEVKLGFVIHAHLTTLYGYLGNTIVGGTSTTLCCLDNRLYKTSRAV